MQRIALATLAATTIAACSGPPDPVPPKAPNDQLIVGEYERHKPDGETAIRFRGDGSYRIAKARGELDRSPYLAEGKWQLDKDQLVLTAESGACTEGGAQGTYKIVISRIGIRFTKVTDDCESRSRMDGQTWWRVK